MREITISLPDNLYDRLQQAAQATRQTMTDVVLQAVQVGSPPSWEDAPAEHQVALAALNRLEDEALWHVAKSETDPAMMVRYEELLMAKREGALTAVDTAELAQLRHEADQSMLCKAHAAALLRWRGHLVPPANRL